MSRGETGSRLNALAVHLHGQRIGIINRLAGDRHIFSFEEEYVEDQATSLV